MKKAWNLTIARSTLEAFELARFARTNNEDPRMTIPHCISLRHNNDISISWHLSLLCSSANLEVFEVPRGENKRQ